MGQYRRSTCTPIRLYCHRVCSKNPELQLYPGKFGLHSWFAGQMRYNTTVSIAERSVVNWQRCDVNLSVLQYGDGRVGLPGRLDQTLQQVWLSFWRNSLETWCSELPLQADSPTCTCLAHRCLPTIFAQAAVYVFLNLELRNNCLRLNTGTESTYASQITNLNPSKLFAWRIIEAEWINEENQPAN